MCCKGIVLGESLEIALMFFSAGRYADEVPICFRGFGTFKRGNHWISNIAQELLSRFRLSSTRSMRFFVIT